ncbi:hypothetical protein L226DRAFT_550946 [Lentinus tigrinus ALCF2SS1-7]|uniref:uncharacterized protein n=1 Tax=Lentinus tigrinus ALCF2SS1-7 TaxID=1328758 RepID=UPI0011662D5E|nr:hypothetical protein L226DRAFT_550946 [Lentinus tigrinus ALCF2SS1-7]
MSVLTAVARSARLAARAMVPAASLSLAASCTRDYTYDALEPHISGQTLGLHHGNDYQAHDNDLNAAEQSCAQARSPRSTSSTSPRSSATAAGTSTTRISRLSLNAAASSLSGWDWLSYNLDTRNLEIYLTAVWNVINFNEPERRFVEPAQSA